MWAGTQVQILPRNTILIIGKVLSRKVEGIQVRLSVQARKTEKHENDADSAFNNYQPQLNAEKL